MESRMEGRAPLSPKCEIKGICGCSAVVRILYWVEPSRDGQTWWASVAKNLIGVGEEWM